jgi:putative RNA 2'-phosphotransferase
MSGEELSHLGRIMAGVLRHFPEKFDVELDEHGWADIDEFVESIRDHRITLHWLKSHHLRAIVETDPKGRYQIEANKFRATYGHTIDVVLDHPTDTVPEALFYPTTQEEMEVLFETGLKPTDRKFVHLSKTYEQAMEAGRHRDGSPIIIEIDAASAVEDGIVIGQAGTVVYITDEVPPKFMSMVKREGETDDGSVPGD